MLAGQQLRGCKMLQSTVDADDRRERLLLELGRIGKVRGWQAPPSKDSLALARLLVFGMEQPPDSLGWHAGGIIVLWWDWDEGPDWAGRWIEIGADQSITQGRVPA
jgi:hypothetical protein